ncbi:eukaryotic translation initiation factor 4 gamma 3-like [Ciona intestinalis]
MSSLIKKYNRVTKCGSGGSAAYSRGRDERKAVLDTARKLTSQEDKKRGSSPSVKSFPRSRATFTPIPQINETFLAKKVDHIIKEYLYLVDLKEAIECILELKVPPNLTHLIVSSSMELSLEKKQSDRKNVANLICDIIKQRIVTEDEFLKGAALNIELAADLELDLPKVWTCMAELVAPVIYDPQTGINLSHLVPMSQQLLELDRSVIFVTEILKKMVSLMPAEGVLKQWVDHNLQWSSFTQSTDTSQLNEMLSKNNLSMFGGTSNGTQVSPVNQTSHKDFSTSVSEITRHLDKLQSDDTMFDWLEATFNFKEQNESQFVRALTTAICLKAIVEKGGAMEVDKEVIKSRTLVFKTFVDTEDKELEAVYALQKLYSDLEQPPNILKLLYDLFYDEEIISEQTFLKWEKTDNPVESEGREVALMAVKPFFTWLREADIESDE